MDENHWPRVRRIIEDALEQPTETRLEFVARTCGADATLRAEVEGLLKHNATDAAFLEPPVQAVASGLACELDSQEAVGARLGPYLLLGVIAVGGMGTVYRARRDDDEYDKEVAIKVLASSLSSTRARQRFHRERQILAQLDHPNITRLLDGGTTADGRPYIVMEFVRGAPITRFAQTQKLDACDRLRLFVDVCRAVQFAHRNLIVHRDLKPGNILVNEESVPKLVDFGISKLIAPGGSEVDPMTITVAAPMTVRYSSPEQVSGEPISTASDVYSLGVLLYELLTDQPPYDSGASIQEALVAIRELIPQPPSSIRPELDREMDAIVLHAMEKQPNRRYATAEAMASDIERYLRGDPIVAHPPTRWYLVRKAAWRHRRALGFAATVFLLVTIFGIVAAGLAVKLSRERTAAMEAGQRESLARHNAEQINTFLAETLVSADPLMDHARDLSLLRLLADASNRLGDQTTTEVQAALRLTIGRAYLNLYLVRDAEPHLTAAEAFYRQSNDSEHDRGLGDAIEHLSEVAMMRLKYYEAEELGRECLAIRRRLHGSEHESTAIALIQIVRALNGQSEFTEAMPLAFEVLTIRRAIHGESHGMIADVLDQIAMMYSDLGDGEQARLFQDQAQAMRRSLFGDSHESLARGLENQGWINLRLGEREAAQERFERAIAARELLAGATHPSTVEPRIHAGILASDLGEIEVAEQHFSAALRIADETLPPWHRTVRYSHSAFGLFLFEQERYLDAEPHLLIAHKGAVRLWGDHGVTHTLSVHLAKLYEHLGRPDLARTYAEAGAALADGQTRQARHAFIAP